RLLKSALRPFDGKTEIAFLKTGVHCTMQCRIPKACQLNCDDPRLASATKALPRLTSSWLNPCSAPVASPRWHACRCRDRPPISHRVQVRKQKSQAGLAGPFAER